MSEDEQPPPTLGQRLDALARRRMVAHEPHLAWAPGLARVLHQAERFGDITGDRFERVEVEPRSAGSSAGRPIPPIQSLAGSSIPRSIPPSRAEPGAPAPGPSPADSGGATRWLQPPVSPPMPEQDPPQPLPPDLRHQLRQVAGPAADLMRVHIGPRSDEVARAADADAVTIGADVHVRRDRFAPRRPDGAGLLAHEATHVAALIDPGRAWQRATGDDRDEETLARSRERDLRGYTAPSMSGPVRRPGPPPAVPGMTAGMTAGMTPAMTPGTAPVIPHAPATRRAAADRDVPLAAMPDLDSLRRSLINDVMRQLKTEFERGG